jgi:hypothetical protein
MNVWRNILPFESHIPCLDALIVSSAASPLLFSGEGLAKAIFGLLDELGYGFGRAVQVDYPCQYGKLKNHANRKTKLRY